jgi:hypothetical protein
MHTHKRASIKACCNCAELQSMAWLPATTSVSSVAARLAIGTATLLYGFPDVRKDARI